MTNAEIERALMVREILLDHSELTTREFAEVMANNSMLLARVIEYYCAGWQEVEQFESTLRIVLGPGRDHP